MAFVSSLSVSSTSSLLSSLKSFLVSTCAWTLIDTGVSGLAENFVVKSPGASGDRNIYLKFGASSAELSGISCWAADGFASATDVTSNATTERVLSVNSGGSLTAFFEGDADHVIVGTNKGANTTIATWVYGGLTQEYTPSVASVPNQSVLVTGIDVGGVTTGRAVESPTGTYNTALLVDSFASAHLNKSDPNLLDGLVYLWPMLVTINGSDRMLGTLRNAYAVGQAIVHNTVLTASGQDYIVFNSVNGGGASGASLAVKNS